MSDTITKVITLRISRMDGERLLFELLSLDPATRIDAPAQAREFAADGLDATLAKWVDELSQAVRAREPRRLAHVGFQASVAVLEAKTRERLTALDAEYLYLDLDASLIGFPWELLALSEGTLLGRRFKTGRHLRLPSRDARTATSNGTFLLVADPTGMLQAASTEGEDLRAMLGPHVRLSYLGSSTAKDELLLQLRAAEGFHFCGHSFPDRLVVDGEAVEVADVLALPRVPFFVFLNSCSAGAARGWEQSTHGLAKAFMEQGAHVLIAALTDLDNRRAGDYARAFYAAFLAGDDVGGAMARAAAALGENPSWANYVLYGNPLYRRVASSDTAIRPASSAAVVPAKGRIIKVAVGLAVAVAFVAALLVFQQRQDPQGSPSHGLSVSAPTPSPSRADEAFAQGLAALDGTNGLPDRAVARRHLALAAERGHAGALRKLAELDYQDSGSDSDLEKSLAGFERAVASGDAAARSQRDALRRYLDRERAIARLLAGEIPDVAALADADVARKIVERFDSGCPAATSPPWLVQGRRTLPASDLAGHSCPLFGKVEKNPEVAATWQAALVAFEESHDVPQTPADMNKMGARHEAGNGVALDLDKAFFWYEKAANAGDPWAAAQVARFYRHGLGKTPRDYSLALRWYRQAVANAEHPIDKETRSSELEDFLAFLRGRGLPTD